MDNAEKAKLDFYLKTYFTLSKRSEEIQSGLETSRNEIQSILEKNNIIKYETQISGRKMICVLFQTISKMPTLLKKVLKNFYCSTVRIKTEYLIDKEKIEKLIKRGKIKPKDGERLFSKEKYLKILVK